MKKWMKNDPNPSVDVIGNGKMMFYFDGINIINMLGPPYGSPNMLTMGFDGIQRADCERIKGSAVYVHKMYDGGESENGCAATMLDYMHPEKNIFIREITAVRPITFHMEANLGIEGLREECRGVALHDMGEYIGNKRTMLFRATKSLSFFQDMPTPWECNVLCVLDGNCTVTESVTPKNEDGIGGKFTVTANEGLTRLIFTSENEYPKAVEYAEYALNADKKSIYNRVCDYWKAFTGRRYDFNALIPNTYAEKGRILDTIDSVAVLIKCQQSYDGGIMAGHRYNLGYVRDMSGGMRGMLAMGYHEEAKMALEFWLGKFNVHGNVYNAEGLGNDAARLLYENDDVEVPAYLIIAGFWYYDETGDKEFMERYLPLTRWAFKIQLPHLVNGMTEFSGDETYIAGNTYPRYQMYQGSSESTMLFIKCGEKLMDYLNANDSDYALIKEKVEEARSQYEDNFIENGVFYANNPKREEAAEKPKFRFGYCDGHNSLHLRWTENVDGWYVCPACRSKKMEPFKDENKRHVMSSISCMPVYADFDLIDRQMLKDILKPQMDKIVETGYITSNDDGGAALGYDAGIMVLNMAKLGFEGTEKAMSMLLDMVDESGAWSEYYMQGKPFGCKCRAWESGVNIYSIITAMKITTEKMSELL